MKKIFKSVITITVLHENETLDAASNRINMITSLADLDAISNDKTYFMSVKKTKTKLIA